MRLSIHRPTRQANASAPSPAPMHAAAAAQTVRAASHHDIGRVPIGGVTQRKAAPGSNGAAYRAPNRTGLPDGLKAGVESLSGLSMDGVRVHFGSSEPARFNAHAFT